MEWSFLYDGPARLVDDDNCDICAAVARGKSCKQAQAYHASGDPALVAEAKKYCPAAHIERRLAAGKLAYCPNHCGIETAVEQHGSEHDLSGKQAESFGAFSACVSAHMASLPKDVKSVYCKAAGFEDVPDSPDLPYASFEFKLTVRR